MILVLGIGNLLWADEGFGVRCAEELHRRFDIDGATILDGGTQGLYLVEHVGDAERVLVFDAIDFHEPPGTLRVLRGDDVPRVYATGKVSLHQAGLWDVLAAADLLGRAPREVVVVGVQAAQLDDYGGSLTPIVAARLEHALRTGLEILREWGAAVVPREEPRATGLVAPGLARGAYEAGRPSPEAAYRLGDARFLPE